MAKLKLLSNVEHNGQRYPSGEVIDTEAADITAEQAAALIDWRSAAWVDDAPAANADSDDAPVKTGKKSAKTNEGA